MCACSLLSGLNDKKYLYDGMISIRQIVTNYSNYKYQSKVVKCGPK